MKYMVQLDALRAFAVFAVIYDHFLKTKLPPLPFCKNSIAAGGMGVDLFYVLSGFLITGILLRSKIKIDSGNSSVAETIKTFFLRRTLRIFPIYYLTLFIGFIFAVPTVRESLWWHLSYTTNFFVAQEGHWIPNTGHLWSLSVEEQFYFIWPWVILLVPRAQLLGIIIFTIASAPLFRHFCSILDLNGFYGAVLTMGSMDLFGIGALLAYLKAYDCLENNDAQLYLRLCKTVGAFMFLQAEWLKCIGHSNSFQVFNRTFEGFFYCWIIYKASVGFKGLLGSILELKPLLYLGRISYGIYLYHNFMPFLATHTFPLLNIPLPKSAYGECLVYTTLAVVVSSVSWYLIEKPVAVLRDKFEMSRAAKKVSGILLVGSKN